MLTININTADGLTNGACGILRKLERPLGSNMFTDDVSRLWIEFSDPNVGKELRSNFFQDILSKKVVTTANVTELKEKVIGFPLIGAVGI